MARFVLDTNIISRILSRNAFVLAAVRRAAERNDDIILCPVAYYEIRRGLLDKRASRQLGELERLAETMEWEDYVRPMWVDAAALWADARHRGRPHDDDADLLMAAYARHSGATIVTNNVRDFEDLDVEIADWSIPTES